MGAEVAADPGQVSHYTRFWTDEPTWRPLLTIRSAAESALFGASVLPRILVNVALHLLAAWLVYLTAAAWFGFPRGAAWAAVLFAAHPLHAEALAWFHSGFEGITVTVFALLTLWSFAARKPLWLGLVALQLAWFTRENALCLPLVLSAMSAARAAPASRWRRVFIETSPYWLLLAVNVIMRFVMVAMAEGGAPTGSFHVAEQPLAALITTFVHPWIPIHPALPLRIVWWLVFAAVPFALVFSQRGASTRVLRHAFVGFALLSLPFLPQFHDAWRFLDASPGGYEQRWYYFHLPLAALVVWPAYVIAARDQRATGWAPLALAALAGLMLTAQTFNARWWVEQADIARATATQLADGLESRPAGVGLEVEAGLDGADLADKVFENAHRIWPDAAERGVRIFHVRREPEESEPVLAMITRDARGQPRWTPVHTLPPATRWWRWDPATDTMNPIEPHELRLPVGATLPSCCAGPEP